jgi:predicted ATPase
MRRFIVTGTPGAGKTAILRQLELEGFSVVEEAATDVIAAEQARGVAEPWTQPSFIDLIVTLQKQRQIRASYLPDRVLPDPGPPDRDLQDQMQFHDRSVVCTAALATYLGYPFSATLTRELERIKTEAIFQPRVFLIQNLGFVKPTKARRISFEDAVRFERIHEETYRHFGFELVPIGPGEVRERVSRIKIALENRKSSIA